MDRTSHYLGNSRSLVRLLAGMKMIVDTDDLSITPHILMDGCWASQVDAVLGRHVKQGDKCLDIGCHYGYTALMLGALSGEAVVCVDMNERMTEICKQNMDLNGFKHEITTRALVARDTLAQPHVAYADSKHCSGGNHLLNDSTQQMTPLTKRVPTMTVAQLQAGRDFDFIKIDAEGMDWYIFSKLVNVKKCLLEHRPVDAAKHEGAWYVDRRWADIVVDAFETHDVFVIDAKGVTHKIASAMTLLEEEGLTHADLLLIAKP